MYDAPYFFILQYRDAVDIYDATNKLVAFHVLLSPGHRTLRAIGVTTVPTTSPTGDISRGGRSSAIVLTVCIGYEQSNVTLKWIVIYYVTNIAMPSLIILSKLLYKFDRVEGRS